MVSAVLIHVKGVVMTSSPEPMPRGAECDFKRHRAAGDGYAVEWFFPAKEFAEGGFEFIDLWTINVATVFKDFGDGGVNLRGALLMDGFDVDELHIKRRDGLCLSVLS